MNDQREMWIKPNKIKYWMLAADLILKDSQMQKTHLEQGFKIEEWFGP